MAVKAGRDVSALVRRSREAGTSRWAPWWWFDCGVRGMEFEWSAFVALNGTRGKGFGEWQPIDHREIEAFGRLHGFALDPWQVSVVRHLDAAWLRAEKNARSSRA